MRKNATLRLLTLMAALAMLANPMNSVSADTISGNGGFETAGMDGAADSDLWNESFGGAAGTTSARDGSNPFEGDFAHFLNAVGDSTTGANAVITQNSIADAGFNSLQVGTDVTASFQWDGTLGPGGVANAFLRILDEGGGIVADSGPVPLPTTSGYQSQVLPTLTVPDTGSSAYASFIEIVVAAGGFDGSFAQGYVDSVDIQGSTAIPEPATASVLGLICIGMLARRRR